MVLAGSYSTSADGDKDGHLTALYHPRLRSFVGHLADSTGCGELQWRIITKPNNTLGTLAIVWFQGNHSYGVVGPTISSNSHLLGRVIQDGLAGEGCLSKCSQCSHAPLTSCKAWTPPAPPPPPVETVKATVVPKAEGVVAAESMDDLMNDPEVNPEIDSN